MGPAATAKDRTNLLLKRADVATWVKDRAPGSAVTQLDHLRIFLERTGLDVDGLVRLAKRNEQQLRSRVLDFIRARQAEGLTTKYVVNTWWAVRSFLVSVGAAPAWNPKVKETEVDEEAASRMVPTHAQVRDIANAVKSARDRAVVLILASSGVRIGTLAAQAGGADGLRLKNLIDLQLEPEPRFERLPPLLRVPSFLSKGGKGYYTGLGPEAAEAILVSLKERIQRGERLTPDSPLVSPDARGNREPRASKRRSGFLVRKSLTARVKAAMNTVAPEGIEWTPHALRAFVSTALETAESRGLVSRSRREFFLGHALGSVDVLYNLGRPLSPSKIEELRESWRKCLPLLDLSAQREHADPAAAFRQALASLVLPDDEEAGRYANASNEELVRLLREKLLGKEEGTRAEGPASFATPTQRTQRLVPLEEAQKLLGQGWTFVANPAQDRVILEAPRFTARDLSSPPAGP